MTPRGLGRAPPSSTTPGGSRHQTDSQSTLASPSSRALSFTYSVTAQADVEELWRRIAFSILITNVDDHLLNHGFLHVSRGHWRLAPAFDVNPFPERAREFKTWISEEAGPEATIEGLLSVGPYFRLSGKRAKAILREVEEAVAEWRAEGRSFGMTNDELGQFVEAFEHPERAAARRACGLNS